MIKKIKRITKVSKKKNGKAKENLMSEFQLVSQVATDIAAGYAAGNGNPVIAIGSDGVSLVLTMTPSQTAVITKTYPVANPNQPV